MRLWSSIVIITAIVLAFGLGAERVEATNHCDLVWTIKLNAFIYHPESEQGNQCVIDGSEAALRNSLNDLEQNSFNKFDCTTIEPTFTHVFIPDGDAGDKNGFEVFPIPDWYGYGCDASEIIIEDLYDFDDYLDDSDQDYFKDAADDQADDEVVGVFAASVSIMGPASGLKLIYLTLSGYRSYFITGFTLKGRTIGHEMMHVFVDKFLFNPFFNEHKYEPGSLWINPTPLPSTPQNIMQYGWGLSPGQIDLMQKACVGMPPTTGGPGDTSSGGPVTGGSGGVGGPGSPGTPMDVQCGSVPGGTMQPSWTCLSPGTCTFPDICDPNNCKCEVFGDPAYCGNQIAPACEPGVCPEPDHTCESVGTICDCQGPDPLCGNSLLDAGEECDPPGSVCTLPPASGGGSTAGTCNAQCQCEGEPL